MRIRYITNVRLPTPKAQGYAIMKMCSEFARAGISTELFVPTRSNSDSKENPFEYYGIKPDFHITKIASLDLLGSTLKWGRLFYWTDILSFIIMSKLTMKLEVDDVLYTRDFVLASFFSSKHLIVLELHAVPASRFLFRRALKKASLFVVLNRYIKAGLVDLGVDPAKIFVSPSAVDMADFAESMASKDKPKSVLPATAHFIFGYIGALRTMGMEKGVDLGLHALALLPPEYHFLIVGGEPEEVEYYREMAVRFGVLNQTTFVGKLPHVERYKDIVTCDVLIAPFPENEHYSYFMSPLKIFEYMASRKPIISTTLPSIQEILEDGKNAVLVPPNDAHALAQALVKLHDDLGYGKKLAEQAYKDVKEKYTWTKRAENILKFIELSK
jgi:glycosyltransferase involved in cell wall biosynthesis